MPTNNSINTPKPIDVSSGGTGLSTATTAYGVIAAGTTATGAFQNIGTGASGEVLTSNGAGALPTFQAAAGGGGPAKKGKPNVRKEQVCVYVCVCVCVCVNRRERATATSREHVDIEQ